MVLCLGEPPRRFLWYWLSHLIFISSLYLLFIFDLHFVVVLHLSFSFIHILFSTSSLTLPWTIYSHSVLSAQPIAEWFATFSFSTIPLSFYRERYGFEWAFFTHRCFLPYAPSLAFIKTDVYQDLPGSWKFFLEVCRASYSSSKHKPGPSVCLIQSNPQSSYSEQFIFKFYQILSWIACGEILIHLLLTHFELFSLVQSHM